MKRLLPYAIAILLPRTALATGILNVLLAGSIQFLTASASPTSITLSAPGSTLTSSSTTCSGHGGIPPYTAYAWSFASGGSGITINSASSASTSFTVAGATVNTTYSGVAQCTATDSRPVTSPNSSGVSVSISRTPLLPPSVGTATLTGAISGPYTGYSVDPAYGTFGSLSPSVDFNGNTAAALICAGGTTMVLAITQPSSNATYITNLNVNGAVFPQSSATYGYSSPYGTWQWAIGTCLVHVGSNAIYYY